MKKEIIEKGKHTFGKVVYACNVLASLSVISGVFLFVLGQRDREIQAATAAWSALANPRPGISVANEMNLLSKSGWFREKSKFENIDLNTASGSRGVSLDGLQLDDVDLVGLTADRSSLSNVSIYKSDLTGVSFKDSNLISSSITSSTFFRAILTNSVAEHVHLSGVMTGLNLESSIIHDSKIDATLPEIHKLNRTTKRVDGERRLHLARSFIRDSEINIDRENGADQCGIIDLENSEIYYTKILIKFAHDDLIHSCFLSADRSWLIGAHFSGDMGFSCANCVVGYSEIQIDEQVGIEEKVKNLEYHYLSSNLNGATFFRSKLSGAAKGIDYSGARFIYSDVSSMDFDGANISGAQFDVFDADKAIQTSDFVDLDNVVKIFYRGYSDPQRSLEIAEEKFDADMRTTDTSAEALERYPSDGFAKAWAWSDRPPIGIPEGVSGPILCDAALRKDNADVTPSMPEGCKIGAHSSAKR